MSLVGTSLAIEVVNALADIVLDVSEPDRK
jgi:hypothetical protein